MFLLYTHVVVGTFAQDCNNINNLDFHSLIPGVLSTSYQCACYYLPDLIDNTLCFSTKFIPGRHHFITSVFNRWFSQTQKPVQIRWTPFTRCVQVLADIKFVSRVKRRPSWIGFIAETQWEVLIFRNLPPADTQINRPCKSQIRVWILDEDLAPICDCFSVWLC